MGRIRKGGHIYTWRPAAPLQRGKQTNKQTNKQSSETETNKHNCSRMYDTHVDFGRDLADSADTGGQGEWE